MALLHEAGDHQRLVGYLLGLLSDRDAERLDELSITDADVAWRLQLAEDDLVDAYVRSTLTGDTLERFESYYLSSAHRRQKVRFAASLLGVVDREHPPGTDASLDTMRAAGKKPQEPPRS